MQPKESPRLAPNNSYKQTKLSTPQLLLHAVTVTIFLKTIKDIRKKEQFVNIMPLDLVRVEICSLNHQNMTSCLPQNWIYHEDVVMISKNLANS